MKVRREAGARIGTRKLVLPLPGKIVMAPVVVSIHSIVGNAPYLACIGRATFAAIA